jgi:hypothetical protein
MRWFRITQVDSILEISMCDLSPIGRAVPTDIADILDAKKPRYRGQPHFSELPAVHADGARGDGSGTPGLAPAHIFGGATVERQSRARERVALVRRR